MEVKRSPFAASEARFLVVPHTSRFAPSQLRDVSTLVINTIRKQLQTTKLPKEGLKCSHDVLRPGPDSKVVEGEYRFRTENGFGKLKKYATTSDAITGVTYGYTDLPAENKRLRKYEAVLKREVEQVSATQQASIDAAQGLLQLV